MSSLPKGGLQSTIFCLGRRRALRTGPPRSVRQFRLRSAFDCLSWKRGLWFQGVQTPVLLSCFGCISRPRSLRHICYHKWLCWWNPRFVKLTLHVTSQHKQGYIELSYYLLCGWVCVDFARSIIFSKISVCLVHYLALGFKLVITPPIFQLEIIIIIIRLQWLDSLNRTRRKCPGMVFVIAIYLVLHVIVNFWPIYSVFDMTTHGIVFVCKCDLCEHDTRIMFWASAESLLLKPDLMSNHRPAVVND